MKKGWERKKLREVCHLINGRAYSKPELLNDGKYRVLRVGNFFTNDHWYYSDLELDESKYCDNGDLLYAWSASFGPRIWGGGKVIYHYHIWKVIHDPGQLEQKFLFYYFEWDTDKVKEQQGTGTTMTHVSMGSMNDRVINFPPLSEQRRIVGLLDEALAGLATTQANAEKNLQNARALFESHLQSVFILRAKGWVEMTLGDCLKVRSGDFLPAKAMIETGKIDVYGGNGVSGRHNRKNLTGQNIVIGRVGAKCGNVHHVVGDVWVTDNALLVSEYHRPFDLRFLARLLRFKDLRSRANQMAQPVISFATIKDVQLKFPESKVEQSRIADQLESLAVETQRLTQLYKQKQAAVVALKKSLLHRAFAGEL